MHKTRRTAKSKTNSKLIKIKKFDHLVNKPAQPKKGISYAIEKAENIDAKTGKKMDGDVYKKYEDGVLKRQIFVPKERVKKLVQNSLLKIKKNTRKTMKIGGKTQKQNPQVIYVQAPPAPVQAQQAQQVVVQDGTSFGQALKTGAASGLGWGLAHVFIGTLFNGDN